MSVPWGVVTGDAERESVESFCEKGSTLLRLARSPRLCILRGNELWEFTAEGARSLREDPELGRAVTELQCADLTWDELEDLEIVVSLYVPGATVMNSRTETPYGQGIAPLSELAPLNDLDDDEDALDSADDEEEEEGEEEQGDDEGEGDDVDDGDELLRARARELDAAVALCLKYDMALTFSL